MNTTKKMFVFDLDGTLLNTNHQVSNENIQALKEAKKKNHLLVIATGRNYIFTQNVLKHIWNDFDYYLGCNAAIMHDIKNDIKFNINQKIDFSFVQKMIEQIKQIGGGIQVSTVWNLFANVFVTREDQWFNKEDKRMFFESWPSIDKMDDNDKKLIMQVSVHLEENKVRYFHDIWTKELGHIYDFSITSKHNIDINIKNVNKLFGIKKVVELENIQNDNVFVFGDSQNDLLGLNYYKNTYAMQNAFEEVKKVAKYTIDSNDTNAIAQVLLKNI